MALRFFDPGGRIYSAVGTANVNLLAWWANCSTFVSILAGGGRTVGTCLRFGANSNQFLTKTLDSQSTWGVAFALRIAGFPAAGSTYQIVSLRDFGTLQVELRILSDGTMTITRNGTVLGTSTVALSLNVWNHIEWKITIHPSAGVAEMRINGTARIGPLTGLNTRNTVNSSAAGIWLGSDANNSSIGTVDFDDFVVWDLTATDANGNNDIHDWIGDCSVTWLLPNGAGTTTQFTPDSGSNYLRVSDTTPDGDTSYVDSSTVGVTDTYTLADISSSVSSIKSLAVVHLGRKTDTGSRAIQAVIRTQTTNYVHPNAIYLSDNYSYSFSPYGSNPNTAVAWSVPDVNALEAGQKINS